MKLLFKYKVYLAFALSVVFAIKSAAQTKQETEDWLSFNLEKYYSSDYNADSKKWWQGMRWGYHWHSYEYTFLKGKLIIHQYTYEIDSANIQTTVGHQVDTINLHRIIKVETLRYLSDNLLRIHFSFKPPEYNNRDILIENSYTSYDLINKKSLIYLLPNFISSYSYDYYIEAKNPDLFNNNLPESFKKAFEYIVKYNGGKIISDIF